jgi:lipid A ethanolaminephosphotransferase
LQPECTTASLQDCPREQVLNAYDNSIAYTDHFLARTIAWLRQHDRDARTAMLYVADHGESLGENGLFLHGMPYGIAPDVQKTVPWITWLSPAWEHASGVAMSCVQQARGEPVSHDHYFHSVLGLADVATAAYRPERDVYGGCRSEGLGLALLR